MSRSRRAVVALVAAAAVPAVAVSSGLATRTHAAGHRTSQASYAVSARATGAKSTGTLKGTLSTSGAKGKLAWSLTLSPAAGASSAQIRSAAGAKLVSLCAPCKASARGAASVGAAAVKGITGGHASLVVATAGGVLKGAVKASSAGSGGGTLTVPVTPAAVAKGKALVNDNGCLGCHTIDGTSSTGPTWKGLAGSTVHLTTGGTTKATDSYLVGVITDPSTLKVAGYDSGIMAEVIPPGKISDAEAKAIVAYIKTIK